jgi:RNA polymerase subunit RPABC4/transcription elongation factor Spt4
MNPCLNCGKLNSPETNFCRFCGTKFVVHAPVPDNPYDYSAPRPYAWKTDEFQTQNEARQTKHIDRSHMPTQDIGQQMPQPLAYRGPQQFAQAYRCPHCMSTFTPLLERRISTAGWITFAALLVFFFPLFWIGLLIKEDVRVCPACNSRVS